MLAGFPRPLFVIVLLSLSLFALVFVWTSLPTVAQNPCMKPAPLLGTPRWKQGAQVTAVFKQGDFSTAERAAIQTALNNWNARKWSKWE